MDKPDIIKSCRITITTPEPKIVFNGIIPLQNFTNMFFDDYTIASFFDKYDFPELDMDNVEVFISMSNDPAQHHCAGYQSLGCHGVRWEITSAKIKDGVIYCEEANMQRRFLWRQV